MTCYLENISNAVKTTLSETSELAVSIEGRDGALTPRNLRLSTDLRSSQSVKRTQTLVFLMSACPMTIKDLMRSIERPDQEIKSIADPLLDTRAAALYAKLKANPVVESFAGKFKSLILSDTSQRLVWIDTYPLLKSALLSAPSSEGQEAPALMHLMFGSWDRSEESVESVQGVEGLTQMAEWLKAYCVPLLPLTTLVTLAHSLLPPDLIAHLCIAQFTQRNQKVGPRTMKMLVGETSFRVALDTASTPSASLKLPAKSITSIFSFPAADINNVSWTRLWIATLLDEEQNGEGWRATLAQLRTSSSALAFSPPPPSAHLLFVLLPMTYKHAYILQLAPPTPNTALAAPCSIDTASGESLHAPMPASQSFMPSRSTRAFVDALSHLHRAEETKFLTKLRTLHDSDDESDSAPVVWVEDLPSTTSSSKSISPNKSAPNVPPSTRTTSESGSPRSAMSAASKETLQAGLAIYFSDLYCRYLQYKRLPEDSPLLATTSQDAKTLWNELPKPTLPLWNVASSLHLRVSSQSSLEASLYRELNQLLVSSISPDWSHSLAAVLEKRVLLDEGTLRKKYLAESVDLDPVLDFPGCFSASPTSKECEFRIQIVLGFVSCKWAASKVEGVAPAKRNPKRRSPEYELPLVQRRRICNLLETVGFLMSSSIGVGEFRQYVNDLLELFLPGSVATAAFVRRRLGFDSTVESTKETTTMAEKTAKTRTGNAAFISSLESATSGSITPLLSVSSTTEAAIALLKQSEPLIPVAAASKEPGPRASSGKRANPSASTSTPRSPKKRAPLGS